MKVTILAHVDIGHGVMVNKAMLDHHSAFYNSPSIFARKLLEMVFSASELKSSSLTGKHSNANKDREFLPALDSTRVGAVIGKCIFFFPNNILH